MWVMNLTWIPESLQPLSPKPRLKVADVRPLRFSKFARTLCACNQQMSHASLYTFIYHGFTIVKGVLACWLINMCFLGILCPRTTSSFVIIKSGSNSQEHQNRECSDVFLKSQKSLRYLSLLPRKTGLQRTTSPLLGLRNGCNGQQYQVVLPKVTKFYLGLPFWFGCDLSLYCLSRCEIPRKCLRLHETWLAKLWLMAVMSCHDTMNVQ